MKTLQARSWAIPVALMPKRPALSILVRRPPPWWTGERLVDAPAHALNPETAAPLSASAFDTTRTGARKFGNLHAENIGAPFANRAWMTKSISAPTIKARSPRVRGSSPAIFSVEGKSTNLAVYAAGGPACRFDPRRENAPLGRELGKTRARSRQRRLWAAVPVLYVAAATGCSVCSPISAVDTSTWV